MKTLLRSMICSTLFSAACLADSGWGLHGAYWKPADGSDAFGPGLRVSIGMVPHVQLDLRVSYFDDVLGSASPASLEVIPWDAMLSLKGRLTDRLDVHGGVGFTYCRFDSNGRTDNSKSGFIAGAGLEFALARDKAFYGGSQASLFVESVYRVLGVDLTPPGADASEKVDLDGFGINAGLMIRW